MAVAAPADFYHIAAHFPPSNPWHADPFTQELFIHGGESCHRWRFNRIYSTMPIKVGDPLPGTVWMDLLLAVLPQWPLSQYKMPLVPQTGISPILIEMLKSPDCHLLARMEMIAGETCSVFDLRGLQRIWIAMNKGLCLMRRDSFDPGSRKLVERILTDKATEFYPKLFLPSALRIQIFSSALSGDPRLVQENRLRIISCVVNEAVPESSFIPVHPPGSLKYSDEQHFKQESPGGQDLLMDIVDFMTSRLGMPEKRPHDSRPWFLLGFGVGVLGGIFLTIEKRVGKGPG